MAAFDFGAPVIGRRGGLGSRFVELLTPEQIDRMNNGTVTGGLASVLQRAVQGMARNRDRQAREEAQSAMMRGLMSGGTPEPVANESHNAPVPIYRPTPGGIGGAARAVSQLGDNPYAAEMGLPLAFAQAQEAQRQEELRRRYAREDERYNLERQDRLADRAADRQFQERMLQMRASASAAPPSTVREYQYFNSLSPDDQRRYLLMKRANPYLNLGDVFAQPDPMQPGQVMGEIGVGVAPDVVVDKEGGRVIQTPGVPGVPRSGNTIAGTGMTGGDRRAARAGVSGGDMTSGGVGITELPPSPEQARKQAETDRMRAVQANVVNDTIDLSRDLVNESGYNTGVAGFLLSNVPGTDAYTLRNRLDTIRANIGFDKLQAMREASPTGGALGQVSEMENRLLQAVYGSLDQAQSASELERVLGQIQSTYNEIVHKGIAPDEAQRRLRQLQGDSANGLSLEEQRELEQLRREFGQ